MMKVKKYSYEQAFEKMKDMGYDDQEADYEMSQYFRECWTCGHHVSVDEQSENLCDQCAENPPEDDESE